MTRVGPGLFGQADQVFCSFQAAIMVRRNIRDEIKNELQYFFSRIIESKSKTG